MFEDKPALGIFQVELTNHCDMSCAYCPHSDMTRSKGHMSAETLETCIRYAKGQGADRLVLHHYGESLLHPRLEERLQQVKQAGLAIQFSTNGTLLEKKLPMMIALDTPIDLTLSVHQWTEEPVASYWNALAALQERARGSQVRVNRAYNVNLHKYFFCSWVKGRTREWNYREECYFLRENKAVVLWNGNLASCCVDCDGESVFSNIAMPGAPLTATIPWRGCPSCDLGHRSRF